MTLGEWKDLFELASYITIVLGLPIAIIEYRRKTKKEQQDREYGTYNALDEKYLEFIRLCFEHPQLDIFDIPDSAPRELTAEEQKRELVGFTMLFSIFERAYLMYADQTSTIKRRQWTGWHEYMTDFCARENFRRAWRISGNTFDTTFQSFIETAIARVERTAASDRVRVHEITPDDATAVANAVGLLSTARLAGSSLTSTEYTYLIASGSEIGLRTSAFVATSAEPVGALVATSLAQDRVVLIPGVAIRGEDTTAWHALLRALSNPPADLLGVGSVLLETPLVPPLLLEQAVPGMGSFRALDLPYRFPDATAGLLWLWSTAEAIEREDLARILRAVIGEFYGRLRAKTMATPIAPARVEERVQDLLRSTPEIVRLQPPGITLRPAASAG